mgnify:CR=1 FL=1
MDVQQLRTDLSIPEPPVTFEEYLAWLDEDIVAEWVDGEIVVLALPSDQHQRLVKFLAHLLDTYLNFRPIGEVFIAPFPMWFVAGGRERAREPDLLYIESAHFERNRQTHLAGPADLVIEIVSSDSVSRDRGDKFVEYEAAGIREYWIVDPRRRSADFYQLGGDGTYSRWLLDAEGWYHSVVLPGLKVKEAWLWQEPLPGPLDLIRAVREMLGIEDP